MTDNGSRTGGGLASWRDGPARSAIEEFVSAVTSGPQAVPQEERVAVFDLRVMIAAILAATGAADQHGFTVVSVRDDWAEVFSEPAA
jgi:hypothetical protein